MIVYIEDALIENFLVTLLILLSTNKIFKTKTKKTRLVFSSLIGAVVSLLYPLIKLNGIMLLAFKLSLGVIIIFVNSANGKTLAKYICFVFLTGLYGGLNMAVYYAVYGTLNIKDNFATYILIILLFFIYYVINLCLSILQKNMVITNFVYSVKIKNEQKQVCDTAFLDSGNTLIDKQNNAPVFIINYKLFTKLFNDINIENILLKQYKALKNPSYIKSGFASGSGKILVFTVDELQICDNGKTKIIKNARLGLVYSKFNKNFNCNMLLNINAFA